jgi:hypothetical protein
VLLFLGGTATGIGITLSGASPFGGGLTLSSADTPEEAAQLVQLKETEFMEALYHYRQLNAEGDDFADPASRYAGLDYLIPSLEAALRQAPADPFFNGMLATARAEQQAVLRRISSGNDNWF